MDAVIGGSAALARRQFLPRPTPVFTASNIHYDIAQRSTAISCGGIGAIHLLARQSGLIDAIDRDLRLLKVHRPDAQGRVGPCHPDASAVGMATVMTP